MQCRPFSWSMLLQTLCLYYLLYAAVNASASFASLSSFEKRDGQKPSRSLYGQPLAMLASGVSQQAALSEHFLITFGQRVLDLHLCSLG